MSFRAILTSRELKNKITGIDLYVSDYQEIPHKIRNTYLYHVIAVTNLFYYKSSEHKQSDVVQFMVSKSFEEFEELYHKLYKRFPSVNFPGLPSKSLLGNKTDERLKCMDEVMKLVASTQKLSSSTMLIEFLKGKKESQNIQQAPLVVKEDIVEEESIPDQECEKTSSNGSPFNTVEEVDEVDLFGVSTTASIVSTGAITDGLDGLDIKSTQSGGNSLFDDDDKDTADDDELFQPPPTEARKNAFDKNYTITFDDSDNLLDVDDGVDDLLKLSQSSEMHSQIKVEKPSAPSRTRTSLIESTEESENESNQIFTRAKSLSLKKKERFDSSNLDDIFSKRKQGGLFDDEEDDDLFREQTNTPSATGGIEGMGHQDILNYIKANEN